MRLRTLLEPLSDANTTIRVQCERAMNTRLEGGCQVPIGSYSEIQGDKIWLRALVGEPDGSKIVRGEVTGPIEKAEELGTGLAEQLLADGAKEILERLYHDAP